MDLTRMRCSAAFCVMLASILCLAWAVPQRQALADGPATAPPTWRTTLDGKVVRFGFSGFEPDFDPIDRVIIAAALRDERPAAAALPETMVVLSAYLENFQPDTTPLLPDLLHQDQVATSLGGFMQGKAALVNAAGRISYRGSLLAEVFLDNSVHLILDLRRVGSRATEQALRLTGVLALSKTLTLSGHLRSARPLSTVDEAALRVARGRPESWQSVVGGLAVRVPAMLGTAGTTRSSAPRPPPRPAVGLFTARNVAFAVAFAATLLGLAIWMQGRMSERRRPSRAPEDSAGPSGDEADAARTVSSSPSTR